MSYRESRASRAKQLAERVAHGPHWHMRWSPAEREALEAEYRRWASTWITPELEQLVPELRKAKP